MIKVEAEGEVIKISRYYTRNGDPVKRIKLKCVIDTGDYTRNIQAVFYGTHKELEGITKGHIVKMSGVPSSKHMVLDNGDIVSWLEMNDPVLLDIADEQIVPEAVPEFDGLSQYIEF